MQGEPHVLRQEEDFNIKRYITDPTGWQGTWKGPVGAEALMSRK